ncbi:MAG TPA: hypothetical protein VM013_09610 [Dehalococcoidia bacterium]|nr:hypothetical protein [Dehalococcoidia bacterium]
MKSQYWRHTRTGEVYAVIVGDDGTVTGACGPLPQDEITAAHLEEGAFHFHDEPELVEDISLSADDYRLVEPAYIGDERAAEKTLGERGQSWAEIYTGSGRFTGTLSDQPGSTMADGEPAPNWVWVGNMTQDQYEEEFEHGEHNQCHGLGRYDDRCRLCQALTPL